MNYLYLNMLVNVFVMLKVAVCEHYVTIPYVSAASYVEIKVQLNNDEILLPVNLMNDFSWTTKTFLHHFNETCLIDDNDAKTVIIGSTAHSAQTYRSSFGVPIKPGNINNKYEPIIEGYRMYIVKVTSFRIYHLGISFAHKYVHTNFSLVDLLHEQRLTDERSFTIVPNSIEGNGTIYVGQTPSNMLHKQLYKGECKAFNESVRWKCKLNKIQIGNSILTMEASEQMNIEFQTSMSKLLIPQRIVDFFKYALNPFIANKQCKVNDIARPGQWILECETNVVDKLPNFILTIDDYSYSIPFSKFFEYQSQDTYASIFKWHYEPKETDNHTLTFGYSFILLFDMVKFNYEHDSVELYSKTIRISKPSTTHPLIQPLLRIITIIFTIGIVVDLVAKAKTHTYIYI